MLRLKTSPTERYKAKQNKSEEHKTMKQITSKSHKDRIFSYVQCTVSNHINTSTWYKCVNLNPTGCMGMQPAESNRGCHPVCCNLLDSAGWVLIWHSSYRGTLRAPIKVDGKISTQPAESNRVQHTGCCTLLNPTGCIPMQPVGFRLTHLYYVDVLIRIKWRALIRGGVNSIPLSKKYCDALCHMITMHVVQKFVTQWSLQSKASPTFSFGKSTVSILITTST